MIVWSCGGRDGDAGDRSGGTGERDLLRCECGRVDVFVEGDLDAGEGRRGRGGGVCRCGGDVAPSVLAPAAGVQDSAGRYLPASDGSGVV